MHLSIESRNETLSPAARAVLEERVESGLAGLANRVTRVRVWLSDENGPRGGIDHACRIQVNLVPRIVLFGEAQGVSHEAALQMAMRKVARRVRQELDRRREHDSQRVAEFSKTEGAGR